MKQALTTSDIEGWETEKATRKAAKTRRAARLGTFAGKTFEELKPKDKDALLKAVALQLGLIVDSDDS